MIKVNWQQKYDEMVRMCEGYVRHLHKAETERDEWKRKALRDPTGLSAMTWQEWNAITSDANQQHMLQRDELLAMLKRIYASDAIRNDDEDLDGEVARLIKKTENLR